MNNPIQKYIFKGSFEKAYKELSFRNYSFAFQALNCDFPQIRTAEMYLFLMYAISQNEDAEKHLSICQYLYFDEQYVTGADSLIRWHLVQALKVSPQNNKVIRWILSVYSGNPDSPFDESEMQAFRESLDK